MDKIVLYSEPVSLVCSLERATYSKEGFVSFFIKPSLLYIEYYTDHHG